MAEINVQRKGPGAWLWIIGLLAAVAVVWIVAGTAGDDDIDVDEMVTVPPVAARDTVPTSGAGATLPANVAAFVAFADGPDSAAAGRGHEYAADGIRRLTAALEAVVNASTVPGDAAREQFAAFQAKADQIQTDPGATAHADKVRDVFTSAADLMARLQQDRWPDSADLRTQIAESRSAAADIDGGRPLLEQTPKVEAFFDQAAEALRTIAAAPARSE